RRRRCAARYLVRHLDVDVVFVWRAERVWPRGSPATLRLGIHEPRELLGALAPDDRERFAFADALSGADDVAPIGPVLDLATDPLPVLLERVVPLHEHLELEPEAGVPDVLAPKHPDPAVDVLAGDERFDLLDAYEVLLVERPEPLDARFELLELPLD